MQKEQISYPELGNIYPGDYLQGIPYDEYINRRQELPAGERVFDIIRTPSPASPTFTSFS